MNSIIKLRYLTLAMLLCGFITAGTLSSCREQKKGDKTEQQGEHPEGEEHPTEEGSAKEEEHPAKDGEEHPAKDGEEHPEKDGE